MPPLCPTESDFMSPVPPLAACLIECDESGLSMVIVCLCERVPVRFEYNGQLDECAGMGSN